jgi:Cys-tRNA(Pro) deacylase
MVDESKNCYIALMHGDMEVSAKEMARIIGVKKLEPAPADLAMKKTGYQFGGTSPFGTKTRLKVFIQKSIFDLERIYINAGKQGLLAGIEPDDLNKLEDIEKVDIAQ